MFKIPNPDKKYRGDEPDCKVLDPLSPDYNMNLSSMLSWYNYENDYKISKEFVRDYLKHSSRFMATIDDQKINLTYSVLARIITQGGILSKPHMDRFEKYIDDVTTHVVRKVVQQKEATPRVSIQEAMQEKIAEYIGELEGIYDDIVFKDTSFNMYGDLMGRQIPQPYTPHVIKWLNRKIAELTEVQTTEDLDLLEAYSFFTARKLKQVIKQLNDFVADAERYGQFKKANRKPRLKKAKPAGQQIAKLKYLKEFAELNLKSINAADIVGAEQVWVYNTANKKLAAYRTDSATGIQVKGTTLQNYDPDISEQRTLRKPEETIKHLLGAGKIQMRKVLTDLSTKTSPVNGRINEDCILVRAVK